MASRRMIASDIFEDDFVGSLSFFERLVWIGLFAVCADDQGRTIDNPAIVRARVFPYDRIDDTKVEAAMEQAATAGKIIRYEKDGKNIIQIVHWWDYQAPSWASPSKFPAPDGWVDRVKYHVAGNKIVTHNWDNAGGFVDGLPSKLPSGLGRAIEEVKEERRGEEEERREEEQPESEEQTREFLPKFLNVYGAKVFPKNSERQIAALRSMFLEYGEKRVLEVAKWAFHQKGLDLPTGIASMSKAILKWREDVQPTVSNGKPKEMSFKERIEATL